MTKRRDFIKKSVLGTAGIAIGGMGFSSKSYAQIIGANERINMAVIGIGGRGGNHISSWGSLKDSHNVQVITLCDADEKFFAERSKIAFEKTGVKPATEWDMRKVFDNPDIHAVSIATPNHWHALATIWACQAGKHVYVEKPACHNIFEGRKMIEASRKYKVRVQVGFQNRSNAGTIEALKFIRDGGIGELYLAKGICYNPRNSIGIAKDSTPPATLHYDLWLGPAPERPYNEIRGHYNWHWFWDTGNGDTGNTGPHYFDETRWVFNKNEHPVSVYSTGGIYGLNKPENSTPGIAGYGGVTTYGQDKSMQETPNTQTCVYKYSDGTMLEFETRGRYTNAEGSLGVKLGQFFYGTDGYVEIKGAGEWTAFRQWETEPFAGSKGSGSKVAGSKVVTGAAEESGNHFSNFLDAIRSGKDSDLHCNITEGHLSSALPHLANISYRLGRGLKFNGATEKFVNDPEADAMLTREYRKPYIVPDEV